MKPSTKLPAGIPATEEEAEKVLLQRLKTVQSESDYVGTLWDLAWFYAGNRMTDLARAVVKVILDRKNNPE
jgi:hypothetical protein